MLGPESIDEPPSGPAEQPRTQPAASPRRAIDPAELLSHLWKQNLPILRDRLASLDIAAKDALSGTLATSRRTEASDIAHKLAGSLGMFGYPLGTELARELEQLLEAPGPLDPAHFASLAAQLRSTLLL